MGWLFNLFGRGRSREALDGHLARFGVRTAGIPDGVRLTMVRLAKEALQLPQIGEPTLATAGGLDETLGEAAALFAYCFLGAEDFSELNGALAAQSAEGDLEEALRRPTGLAAQVVLLALHSGLAHETIARRFEVEKLAPT